MYVRRSHYICGQTVMEKLLDYLEEIRDLKKLCVVRFRDVQGMEAEVRGHIVKMDQVSGRDMIETDAGLLIGLDQIIAVDGRLSDDYC